MATAWISEYETSAKCLGGVAVTEPRTTSQTVTFTTTTQSSAFGSQTKYIQICASADCHFRVGSNPTAATTDMFLLAGQYWGFQVEPGHKIAFVTA